MRKHVIPVALFAVLATYMAIPHWNIPHVNNANICRYVWGNAHKVIWSRDTL